MARRGILTEGFTRSLPGSSMLLSGDRAPESVPSLQECALHCRMPPPRLSRRTTFRGVAFVGVDSMELVDAPGNTVWTSIYILTGPLVIGRLARDPGQFLYSIG